MAFNEIFFIVVVVVVNVIGRDTSHDAIVLCIREETAKKNCSFERRFYRETRSWTENIRPRRRQSEQRFQTSIVAAAVFTGTDERFRDIPRTCTMHAHALLNRCKRRFAT